MRRLWRMRKILIPQAVAFLFIAAAILCSPTVGLSRETEKAVSKGAGGAIITTTEEQLPDGGISVETSTQTLKNEDAAGVPRDVVIETAGTVYGLDP